MAPQTYKGWFIGTGYEYAHRLPAGPVLEDRISLRPATSAERAGLSLTAPLGALTGGSVGFEASPKYVQTIRSELVYRFNFGGGPVVARY